jgi:hypothetical protein
VEDADSASIAIEKVNLAPKLIITRPIVVAIQEGDIFAITLEERVKKISFRSKVRWVVNNSDTVPMFTFELPQYGRGRICGAIFAYHDFVFEIGILLKYAPDSLLDELFVIVGDHANANLHHSHLDCRISGPDVTDHALNDHVTPFKGRRPVKGAAFVQRVSLKPGVPTPVGFGKLFPGRMRVREIPATATDALFADTQCRPTIR